MRVLGLAAIVLILSGCSTAAIRPVTATAMADPGSKSLLVFSVLRTEPLLIDTIEFQATGGSGKPVGKYRHRIDPSDSAEPVAYILEVPPGKTIISGVVFRDRRHQARWVTSEEGPELDIRPGETVYLGRLFVEAIKFVLYDDTGEKRPDAIQIGIADQAEIDLGLLGVNSPDSHALSMRKVPVPNWSSKPFVTVRLEPRSGEEILRKRWLEDVFCIPTVTDFDPVCE